MVAKFLQTLTRPVDPPLKSNYACIMGKKPLRKASIEKDLKLKIVLVTYYAPAPKVFANHGTCLLSNKWLTAAMVTILAALSLFLSFTDSIVGRDRKLYYGVATLHGFNVFSFSGDEKREWALGELQRLRLRPLNYVHAFFTAVVFLTVAFSDAGLQRCFFPSASPNTKELLTNLPLGMAFLSSFLFMIFPSKRKGIGYNDTTPYQKAA
ncbi:protein DMP2-like [Phragmites australis]|uniref:protein DMP2-like n=1 Tax=Phragmites australis TaxID=29695 RepID=UPI002D76DF75|nr:protein DMP2-like [Phragmites australis]